MSENYFTELNSVNVGEHIEKKNGLSYVSWAWAWTELKKLHPDAIFTIYENNEGWNYFTDGKTCWVKTGVTVNNIEHIEYLPVMDFRNKSISKDSVTSVDVNKTIQRSLTKACARHGLGLYVYAGEDLPEEDKTPLSTEAQKEREQSLGSNPEYLSLKEKLTPFLSVSYLNSEQKSKLKETIDNFKIDKMKAQLAWCEKEKARAGAA